MITRMMVAGVLALGMVTFTGCKDETAPVSTNAADHNHDHNDPHHDHTGHDHAAPATAAAGDATKVQFVNVLCPVSTEKLNPASGAFTTVTVDGKTYGLCCADCIEPFKKDPAKYLAKLAAPNAPDAPRTPDMPSMPSAPVTQ